MQTRQLNAYIVVKYSHLKTFSFALTLCNLPGYSSFKYYVLVLVHVYALGEKARDTHCLDGHTIETWINAYFVLLEWPMLSRFYKAGCIIVCERFYSLVIISLVPT